MSRRIATMGEMERLGKKLKCARERMGLTEPEIAEQIGIASNSVSRYECARSEIPAAALERFAKFYRVDMEWFFGRTSSHQDPPEVSEEDDGVLSLLLDICRKAPPSLRRILLAAGQEGLSQQPGFWGWQKSGNNVAHGERRGHRNQ